MTNIYFKHNVWDSVQRKDVKQLLFRVGLGIMTLTAQMIAIRALPLVLVSMVMNTVPLITALLGYFMLKETLRTFEKIALVISFVGVAIMIAGK